MGIITILLIIFIILSAILIIKFLKNITSAIFLIIVLLIILTIISGIIIFKDINDFRKNFVNSNNLFLLKQNNKILAGIQSQKYLSNIITFDRSTLNNYQSAYNNNDLERVRGNNYKIIIFNLSVLEEIDSNISFAGFDFQKSLIISLLITDMPIDMASEYFSQKENINATTIKERFIDVYKTDQEFKDYLFIAFLKVIFPKKTDVIINGIRDKEIIFFPETPVFQLIKGSPKFLTGSIKENLQTIYIDRFNETKK